MATSILPRVKITNVDMHGFCGRDFHPSEEHVGLEGQVVRIDTEWIDASHETDTTESMNQPYVDTCEVARKAAEGLELLAGCSAVVYLHVWMDEGFLLQLVEDEVEVLPEAGPAPEQITVKEFKALLANSPIEALAVGEFCHQCRYDGVQMTMAPRVGDEDQRNFAMESKADELAEALREGIEGYSVSGADVLALFSPELLRFLGESGIKIVDAATGAEVTPDHRFEVEQGLDS